MHTNRQCLLPTAKVLTCPLSYFLNGDDSAWNPRQLLGTETPVMTPSSIDMLFLCWHLELLSTSMPHLPMKKDTITIQHQISLKVVLEQQPVGLEVNSALHGFRSSVSISNQALEEAAAARRRWSAVGDHLHAWSPKTVSAIQDTD